MESMTLSKMLTTKTWCPKCRVSKFAKQNEWLDQCSNSFPLESQPWHLFGSIEAPFWTLLVGFRSMLTPLWTVLIHCRDINIGQRPLTRSNIKRLLWADGLLSLPREWHTLQSLSGCALVCRRSNLRLKKTIVSTHRKITHATCCSRSNLGQPMAAGRTLCLRPPTCVVMLCLNVAMILILCVMLLICHWASDECFVARATPKSNHIWF